MRIEVLKEDHTARRVERALELVVKKLMDDTGLKPEYIEKDIMVEDEEYTLLWSCVFLDETSCHEFNRKLYNIFRSEFFNKKVVPQNIDWLSFPYISGSKLSVTPVEYHTVFDISWKPSKAIDYYGYENTLIARIEDMLGSKISDGVDDVGLLKMDYEFEILSPNRFSYLARFGVEKIYLD